MPTRDMSSAKAQQQTHNPCPPHAVCIPYPAQGHINPMLKLAKLLHHKGFHITFINTEFNHRRLLKSQGPHSLSGTSSFRFENIPDGLPPSEANATQDIPALCHSILHNFIDPFRILLAKLNHDAAASSDVPPVTCIVSDLTMSFTQKVAEEVGIPAVFFFPASATALMGLVAYPQLIQKGLAPLKEVWSTKDDCFGWNMMHVHLKRHLMKDLPETDDVVAQWCKDMFVAKRWLNMLVEWQVSKWGSLFPMHLMDLIPTALENHWVFVLGSVPSTFQQ